MTDARRQSAVITGAASGIGRACADLLLANGWSVTGWDLDQGDLDIAWEQVDVSSLRAVEEAASAVERLDLLVNCAGIADRAPAAEMTERQWERVIAVDLSGTFYCCRALHGALAAGGGTIVNLASIAGHRSFAGRANYCAAKAGVVALTEVLGQEWAPDGIRVIAVSPGYVMTSMMRAGVERGQIDIEAVHGRTPQQRAASVEEIAGSIVALAGEPFSFMTGTTVIIDGGWVANGGF